MIADVTEPNKALQTDGLLRRLPLGAGVRQTFLI